MSKSSQMSKYLIPNKEEIKELYWDPYYHMDHRHPSLGRNIFELIWQYYSSSNRYYHNINHIVSCHQQLDTYEKVEFKHPAFVRFAIWFHDVIYDTRQNNNEEMSALLAKTVLFNNCVPEEIEAANELILFTKHNRFAENEYEKLISDIDLSILGTFGSEYKKYSEAIRLEYGWVPDYMYYSQRLKILKGFYNKENIYYNELFKQLYEIEAKNNLRGEIREIEELLGEN